MSYEPSHQTRRRFVQTGGAILGGALVGSTSVSAQSEEVFIVDTGNVADESGIEVIHPLDPIDAAVVRGSEATVDGLDGNYAPDVEVSLDDPLRGQATAQASATDEPLYDIEWDKQVQEIPEVHEVTRGEGALVTVIDTGIDADHPDLEGTVDTDRSRNFIAEEDSFADEDGHGTHVAGTIAANDRNERGVVGSAPGAEIAALRVLGADGSGSFGDILAAIVYSGEIGADVANLSLGGVLDLGDRESRELYATVYNRATSYVSERAGTLVVVAAGNAGYDLDTLDIEEGLVYVPAENRGALTVGATGPIGFEWGEEGLEEPPVAPADVYTNYGEFTIDLAAPGGNYDPDAIGTDVPWYYDLVLSTVPAGTGAREYDDYGWKAGTSMAAPQVAAAGALVKSVDPDAMPYEVEGILKGAASVPDGFDKQYYGEGFVDPLEAVRSAQ